MGRIVAIDYGTKRTGIAVSDPLRIIAGDALTLQTQQVVPWLKDYATLNEVDIIVVGEPIQTTGAPSQTHAAASALASRLRKEFPAATVVMYDERYTSVMAHRAMIESGISRTRRRDKALVDTISATIILQGFMESMTYRNLVEKPSNVE